MIRTTSTTREAPSRLLERVRSIVPHRALTPLEALHVAERQAALLLSAVGVNAPPVPHSLLVKLPFITVAKRSGLSMSAATSCTDIGWVILLNDDEPDFRQAFSLAHELKHILDDPFINRLYPATGGYSSPERAEWICNYFAACLLMPKRHVTHDWCSGFQDIRRLAARYRVSRQAMNVRLSELGLLAPVPRCEFIPERSAA
jgi:Zn-dependent peptidase ImmA (M78 family)